MKKYLGVLVAVGLFLPQLAWSAPAAHKNFAPVTQFVAVDSVLGSYYVHFVKRFGGRYGTQAEAFHAFCHVLRTSDLLADEMIQVGIPTDQLFTILRQLETADVAAADHESVRRALLTVDHALETIDSMLNERHRTEFRREVLAEVPTMAYTG